MPLQTCLPTFASVTALLPVAAYDVSLHAYFVLSFFLICVRVLAIVLPPRRGQSIKVFSQLLRKAKQRGYILPFKKGGGPGAGDGVAYEGATVLEPKIGMYPCVVLAHLTGVQACLDHTTMWRKCQMLCAGLESRGCGSCGSFAVLDSVGGTEQLHVTRDPTPFILACAALLLSIDACCRVLQAACCHAGLCQPVPQHHDGTQPLLHHAAGQRNRWGSCHKLCFAIYVFRVSRSVHIGVFRGVCAKRRSRHTCQACIH